MTSEGQLSKWHVQMQAMHCKRCTCKKVKADVSHTIKPPQLTSKFNVPHLFSGHLVTYTEDALLDLARIRQLNLLILKMDMETNSEKNHMNIQMLSDFLLSLLVHTEVVMKIKRLGFLFH